MERGGGTIVYIGEYNERFNSGRIQRITLFSGEVRGSGWLSFEAVSNSVSELTGGHCKDLCELSKAGCVATLIEGEKRMEGRGAGGRE